MIANCGTCRYFSAHGDCRKRAPVIGTGAFADRDAAPYAYWPAVSSKHWCGDHRARRTDQGENK